MSVERRRAAVDRDHPKLSVSRQCRLLSISRGGLYYEKKGESAFNLALMRRIDEQYLNTPWYGSRQLARCLKRMGYAVGRKRVRRLMRMMGLRSLSSGPAASRRHRAHRVYPYLLRDRVIERANQV